MMFDVVFPLFIPSFQPSSSLTHQLAVASPVLAISSTLIVQRRFAPVQMLHSAIAAETQRSVILHKCANLPSSRPHIRRQMCKNCKTVNQLASTSVHLRRLRFALVPPVAVSSSRDLPPKASIRRRHMARVDSPRNAPASCVFATARRSSSATFSCCRSLSRHPVINFPKGHDGHD